MPEEGASTLQASPRPEKVRSRGQCPGWGDEVWASYPSRLPAPQQEAERLLTPARPPVGLKSSGPKSMAGQQEAGKDPREKKPLSWR